MNASPFKRVFAYLLRPRVMAMIWAMLLVTLMLGLNEYAYHASMQHLQQVERLQQQRSALNEVLSYTLDAETGQRGYLLTGNEAYLVPYQQAVRRIDPLLDKLRGYYIGSPQEMAQFAQISRPISRKLAEMEMLVQLRRQANGVDLNWQAAINTDVGLQYMDAVRKGVVSLMDSTDQQLQASSVGLTRNLLYLRIALTLVSLLGLFIFYRLLLQLHKAEQAAIERTNAILAERDLLGEQVRERTARLSELTTHVLSVQEEERGRIARDLHDEMGALFTSAKLDTARVKSRLTQLGVSDSVISERLQHLVKALNSGVAFKRQLIEALQPSSLKHLGLKATLENYAREFGERSDVHVHTDIENVAFSPDTQLVAFRVVQEALNNIAKYAQAQHVHIKLHNNGVYGLLEVMDDGIGFDLDSRSNASYGLPGMRHRVESQAGTLRVISAPGQGTRIEVGLPQQAASRESTAGNEDNSAREFPATSESLANSIP